MVDSFCYFCFDILFLSKMFHFSSLHKFPCNFPSILFKKQFISYILIFYSSKLRSLTEEADLSLQRIKNNESRSKGGESISKDIRNE